MTVHEYCLIDDQPLKWCRDPEQCRRGNELIVAAKERIQLSKYMSGWERITWLAEPNIAAFRRGEFVICLIGKHDIRLTGKGFTGEMRFYDAAKKVMEIERNELERRVLQGSLRIHQQKIRCSC